MQNKIKLRILSVLMALFIANSVSAQKKVIAYVPNWIDLPTFSQSIDYSKLTHINIAFENPTDLSGNMSFASGNSSLINAAHAKGVKVLMSFGGAGSASDATLQARIFTLISSGYRAGFVQKLLSYIQANNFDGIDIDLEGPAVNGDYGNFISDLAASFHPAGKLVTAAISSGYGGPSAPNTIFANLDWLNMMSYDLTGPWAPNNPGPHSPYSFAVSDFNYWTGRGLPAAKAMVGLPFYGYGFGSAFNSGGYTYAQIVNAYPGAENVDQIGSTIYYNGIPTIKQKTTFAVQNAGGVMIWELSQDISGAKSLLLAIDQVINANVVIIPQGPYSGIASPIPGKIEAENYDVGGQNVAYYDATSGNSGNAYRTDDVDVEACTDANNGYDVGYIAANEWMEYSVNVSQTANYIVDFRFAALNAGGIIQIKKDNVLLSSVTAPSTAGWTIWGTVTDTIALTAGTQVLQIFTPNGNFNLNWINFTKQAAVAYTPVSDYETTILPFVGFEGGTYTKVANPYKSGINTSNNVAKSDRGTVTWSGINTPPLAAKLDFSVKKAFKIKVYSPVIGNMLLKFEDSNDASIFKEVPINNTVTNQWEQLVYDCSSVTSNKYDKITLFFDFGSVNPNTFYFDDIIQSNLITTSVSDLELDKVSVYPNPATNQLIINNGSTQISSIDLLDLEGQIIKSYTNITTNPITLNISDIESGMYLISIYSSSNQAPIIHKIIKQ